jgi:hypothetical protein
MDCFASLAMTVSVAALLAMTSNPDMTPHSRGGRRPRFAKPFRPAKQRAPGMPGASCTHSLACNVKWHTSVVTTGTPEITRHSPRNGFTAYIVLSPATSSCCHRHPRIKVLSARSGRLASANLAPATGARRHGFAVRKKRRSSCTPHIAHEVHLALRLPCAPDAFTSTASRPVLVTTRDRPSGGTRRVGYAPDLGWTKTRIFLIPGLDTISENQK